MTRNNIIMLQSCGFFFHKTSQQQLHLFISITNIQHDMLMLKLHRLNRKDTVQKVETKKRIV